MSDQDPRVSELIATLEASPADESAWDSLEDLAAELQRPDEVAAAYRRVLAPGLSAELIERIGQRALGFHEEWFGDSSPLLVEVFERLLSLDPSLAWALSRLTVLFTMQERWTELLAHFDRAIAASGDDQYRKTALLEEAAQLAKDFANQPARAIDYLHQLLELRPTDAQLFTSLERLLEREGRHADLIALWRRRVEGAAGDKLRIRIAETYLDKLADPASALAEARELAGHDDAAALTILERVHAHAGGSLEVRREALKRLRDVYEASHAGADVERVLEAGLSYETRDGAIGLHRELAERIAARGDAASAFTHQASLLALDPSDLAAAERLAELAQSSGDAVAHALALATAADSATASRRIALLVESADVLASAGDAAEAEAAYRRVLAQPEAAQSIRLDLARKLSALLEGANRPEDQLAALEAQAGLERDPAEKRRVLGLVAQLATRLAAFPRALAAWGERLTNDANDVDALDARIAIFRHIEDWDSLQAALRDRLLRTVNPALRRAVGLELAEVLDKKLEDDDAAIEAYRAVATEFGEDVTVVDALERLYRTDGRGEDRQEILTRAAKNDADRAVEMLVRLAEARRSQGATSSETARVLLRALRLDPTNVAAREALTALLEDPSMRSIASEALADAATQVGDYAVVLQLLPVRLDSAESSRARLKLLREAAEIQEQRLGDVSGAFDSMSRALAEAPQEESLERELLRLGDASGRLAEAGPFLSAAASKIDEPSRASEVFRSASRVRGTHAKDASGALADAIAALRLVPRDRASALEVLRLAADASATDASSIAAEAWVTHAFATRALDRGVTDALEAAGEVHGWDALLDTLEANAARVFEEARTRASAPHLRSIGLGDLARDMENQFAAYHRDRRGDETRSMAALSRALEHDPAHADTLRELARLQWRAPGRPLITTLLSLSDRLVGDLDALHDAARIAVDPVGDLVLAREVLERLFQEATRLWRRGERARGEHPPEATALAAHAEIVQLELQASRYERAIEWLVEGSRLPIPAGNARLMLRRAADIAREKLNDEERALRLYQQVIDGSLEDGDAVQRVGLIYEARNRIPELLALRQRELELPLESERKLGVRLDIARLLGLLEDKGGRLEVLRSNLNDVPGHEPSILELSRVLEAKGQSIELHELLSTQGRRLEEQDATRAARLWAIAARVAEQRMSDPDKAIAAHRRVAMLSPGPESFDALARLYLGRGEPGQAAEWLERRLEATTGPERIELHVRLAEARLLAGRNDRATLALERALTEAPGALEVRERLAKLYREQRNFESLARLLADGVLAGAEADATNALAHAKEAALLFRNEVGDVTRAIPVLEHASTLGTLDHEMKTVLAEAYRAAGRLDDARTVLEALVTDFGRRRSPERALVHFQLAQVARSANDLKEALDQLDKASSMDMGHAGILRMQGELAREAGQLDRSERAYRALLLVVRRQRVDSEDHEVGASEVLYELARLAQERGQESQAKELLESARETAGQHMAEAARFTRVLLARRDVPLAEEMIALRMQSESTPASKARVFSDKATLLDSGKRDAPGALAARLASIELVPDSRSELDAARELALRTGAAASLATGLEMIADKHRRKEDTALASDLLLRAGAALEEDGKDLERAVSFFQRVETLGAHSVEAWRALGRIAQKRGDRVEEIRVLRRLVAAGAQSDGLSGDSSDLDESARTDALYRIAEVELRSEETVESGLDTLRDAVKADGDNARAARIAGEAAQLAPGNEGLLLFWERAARDAGDADSILGYLKHRIAGGGASLDEVQEGVTLATALGDDESIEAMLLRGVEAAEASLGGLANATWIPSTLAERRAQAGDLKGAIAWTMKASEAVDAAGDQDRALDLLRDAANLAARDGTDLQLAASAFDKLIARTPSDRGLWASLADVHGKLRDREGYETAVRSALDALLDPTERSDLRLALADQLLTTYRAEADGVAVLREIVDDDPDHLAASERLLDIFQRNGENEALADMLRRQLDRARDRGDVVAISALSLRRGALVAPSDRAEAMDVYRSALDWAPEDARLLRALFGLYDETDDQHDRAQLGERLLALVDGAEGAPLARSLAATYAQFEDDDAVGRVLWGGYRAASGDEGLRTSLEQWLDARGDREGLAEVAVLDALQRQDPQQRTQRLLQASALFQEIGRPERAVDVLGEAVAASPTDAPLFAEYVTALVASGRAEDGIPLATNALEDRTGASRANVLAQRARLLTAAGDTQAAVQDLEDAFQAAPREHRNALIECLGLHRARVEANGDREEERRATLRLAALLSAGGEADQARTVLAHWVSRDADDVLALRTLRDIDLAAGRHADALGAAARLVEIETGDAQVDAALRLYEAAERAGAPGAARPGLERVFQDQPAQKPIRDALRAMYESTESFSELADLLRVDAEEAAPDARFDILKRVGEILVYRVGDAPRAIEPVRAALAIKPDDGDAIVLLADAYMGSDALAEAVEILNDAINQKGRKRTPALAGMQLRMARIAGMSGDAGTQVEWLKVALDTDKGNNVIAAELAELALAMGDDATASVALRVVSLQKTAGPMTKAVASLRQAEIAQRAGDRQKAVLLARRARIEDPDLAEVDRFLASIGEG